MKDKDLLLYLAKKYIHWQTPQESMKYEHKIIARVMTLGVKEDVDSMLEILGEDRLKEVLKNAEIGDFDKKSWNYWHIVLGLCTWEFVPNMPKRSFLE